MILGFSGLEKSRQFKLDRLPDLDPREYAITQGADAAAALVLGGEVVGAAAQERFDGVKHSAGFPAGPAGAALAVAGRKPADLDLVAHAFSFEAEREFYTGRSGYHRDLYDEALSPQVNQRIAEQALDVDLTGKFLPVPHHVAHAASAYYPSGYDDALVLVSDGLGERYSATVFAASRRGFEVVSQVPANSSLGVLYGVFTLYLGFAFGDGEYKVMGLAPHGDASRYAGTILREWVSLDPDGRYRVPLLLENTTELDRETHRGAIAALERVLGPRRLPHTPIEQRHRDVAAGLQAVLNQALLHQLDHHRGRTGLRRLCLAGGVALNCVANGVLLRSRIFDDIYVQPAAGDDGAALGAALVGATELGDRPVAGRTTALGSSYDPEQCRDAVERAPDVSVRYTGSEAELLASTAELIADGKVIGWFQGPMEFGPRALGGRSILADPRRSDMRDRINSLVKKRESFRPFAPAVPEEAAAELFEIAPEDAHRFAHMLFVAHVRPEHAARMPATTHVDGSARVQTVARADAPLFWGLLHAFGDLTGLPVVLNTSFNVAGQPIVRTPDQAIETFLAAGLDALVIDGMVVSAR
ncbi:carbamoyltransferase [Amycolatopsis sp. cmx-4-83]|uniref:carbamoyltransferase family protein n=1 Tax=Amycolatopsis sp. cmx-4-83 TaxID=2790940 RepID=UPI00397899E0